MDCPHKQLKKQLVGEGVWYKCIACPQKFKAEAWDGKVTVVAAPPSGQPATRPKGQCHSLSACLCCYGSYTAHQKVTEHCQFCDLAPAPLSALEIARKRDVLDKPPADLFSDVPPATADPVEALIAAGQAMREEFNWTENRVLKPWDEAVAALRASRTAGGGK